MAHARGGLSAEGRVLEAHASRARVLRSRPGPAQPTSAGASRVSAAGASAKARRPAGSSCSDPARRVGGWRVLLLTASEPPCRAFGNSKKRATSSGPGRPRRSLLPASRRVPSSGGRTHGEDGQNLPKAGRRAASPGPGGLRLLVTSRGSSRGVTPPFPGRGAAAERAGGWEVLQRGASRGARRAGRTPAAFMEVPGKYSTG